MASIIDIIPLEIIERIIDILASDDHFQSGPRNTLQFPNVKACALTCRAFYPRSRYQRFRGVKIYDKDPFLTLPKGSASLGDFERFVKTYPEYAREVRELHYSIRIRSYRPLIDSAVPKSLTNLQSLVLTSYRGSMDWMYTIPSYDPDGKEDKDTLLQILHLPTLLSLKVTRTYNFRPFDLFECTNLQRLSLQSVSVLPKDDDQFHDQRSFLPENAASIRLRHLEVGGSAIKTVAEMTEAAFPGECPVLDLQDLTELTIKGGLQEEYLSSTKEIIRKIRSLQSISFEVGRQQAFEEVTDIVELILASVELRHLSIDLYLSRFTEDKYDSKKDNFRSLIFALAFISHRAPQSNLTSLQIQIRIGPDECGWFSDDDWTLLKEILIAPDAWPALTHFDLALIVQGRTYSRRFTMENLYPLPDTLLSELSSRKGLNFTFFCGKEGQYLLRTMTTEFLGTSY